MIDKKTIRLFKLKTALKVIGAIIFTVGCWSMGWLCYEMFKDLGGFVEALFCAWCAFYSFIVIVFLAVLAHLIFADIEGSNNNLFVAK